MSEFENILVCLLVPVIYVIIYIAGKYDVLSLLCKRLQEQIKEYEKEEDRDHGQS